MEEIKRILIAQTAFVGDVILVTSLIRETKKLFPEAEIDVLVIPATKTILANNPYISEILVFAKKSGKFFSFLNILRQLRKKRYDLVLIPHSSFTSALLCNLAGIKKRIGYSGKLRSLLMTDLVSPAPEIHRIERNFSLLQPHGFSHGDWQTELYPSAEDETKVQSLLPPKTKPRIAIAPGSVWKTKCWPEEYYTELVNLLKERVDLIFVGAREEAELCTRIINKSGTAALNLAGQTTLLQSAAVIRQCDLIICNDSGALHLANAMQTPVLAFFGPTVKRFGFYPYRGSDKVFEKELECRPCSHHGPMKCPLGHHNCMKLITPREVFVWIGEHFCF